MNLPRIYIFIGLVCLPAWGQINVPKIGTARYQDGSFHTVQGLPNNMIVADLPLDAAQVASFSDKGGLIVQDGTMRLLAADYTTIAEYPVLETPLVEVDGDLTSALAWFPKNHLLVHWSGSRFDAFPVADSDVEGAVTALQSRGPRQARLIVEHADKSVSGVTLSLRNGNLVSSEPLPGVQGYTVGQSYFYFYAMGPELIVDNLKGYRRSVTLPAPDFVSERMSSEWFHLYSAKLNQHWALHVTQADLQLSMLPGIEENNASHLASSGQGTKE